MAVFGCAGRPALFPNSDPTLNRSSTEFAVDAAKRFPFKADAPSGGDATARAQVGVWKKVIEIENLGSDDWENVEVWINQKYVVFVPKMQQKVLKTLPFSMLFDDNGHAFPREGSSEADARVSKVQIFRDGKMYDVKLQLAD